MIKNGMLEPRSVPPKPYSDRDRERGSLRPGCNRECAWPGTMRHAYTGRVEFRSIKVPRNNKTSSGTSWRAIRPSSMPSPLSTIASRGWLIVVIR